MQNCMPSMAVLFVTGKSVTEEYFVNRMDELERIVMSLSGAS